MWLHNINVRVKKYSKGWAVEIEKTKQKFLFLKVKYWTHIEAVSGMSDKPWYFETKEAAIEVVLKHFEWDLLISVNEHN